MIAALILLAFALLSACGALLAVLVRATRRAPAPGPRLTGRTVLVERAGGPDVVNVRGIVIAHHADRLTLGETMLIGPVEDVPAEHRVLHVPMALVLSVSEISG